jgi:PKD repeat protein
MGSHHITRRPKSKSCVFFDDLPRVTLASDPLPPPPVINVNFVAVPVSGFAPLLVQFTNLSVGALAYVWDFGDGSPTVTTVHPAHTFTAPGTYLVTLVGTGPGGTDTEAKPNYVIVSAVPPAVPVANFSAAPLASCAAPSTVLVKQVQTAGGASVGDGMAQSGPAVAARDAWLAGLLSFDVDTLQGRTPTTLVNYNDSTPLSLWGGLGTLKSEDEFAASRIVDGIVTTGNGRFNASANANGNWYEANFNFNIVLSSPRSAFGCYVMDVGDLDGSVELDFYNGATVIQTVVVPSVPPNSPNSNEAMWVAYQSPGEFFDRIAFRVIQTRINPSQFDYIGFDNFTVGLHAPCTPTGSNASIGVPPVGVTGDKPLSVQFTNLSTNATSYVWNFGDGSATSTATNPLHVYTAIGAYTVSLTGIGPGGSQTETKALYIQVLAPKPRFFVGPANAFAVGTAAFIAGGTILTNSAPGGKAGSFSLTTTAGNYGWLAVPAAASAAGVTFFDGIGSGGWSGAGQPGNFSNSDTTDTSSVTFTDSNGFLWRLFRQDYVNANPVAATYTTS